MKPSSITEFLFFKNRFGRNNFQESMKIANRNMGEIDWTQFKYMVFDVPTHRGTYQERYAELGPLQPPSPLSPL